VVDPAFAGFSPQLLRLGVGHDIWANVLFEQSQDLTWLRMATQFFLGVKKFAINFELEGSLSAHDEPVIFNDMLIVGYNVVRHTDGSCGIVSRHAVFERDVIFFHVDLQVSVSQCYPNKAGSTGENRDRNGCSLKLV
jgi:hypothetical protein